MRFCFGAFQAVGKSSRVVSCRAASHCQPFNVLLLHRPYKRSQRDRDKFMEDIMISWKSQCK